MLGALQGCSGNSAVGSPRGHSLVREGVVSGELFWPATGTVAVSERSLEKLQLSSSMTFDSFSFRDP